jgi:hypothetical protein
LFCFVLFFGISAQFKPKKSIRCSTSFGFQSNSDFGFQMRKAQLVLLLLFYSLWHRDHSYLPKVTQLVSGKAKFKPKQSSWSISGVDNFSSKSRTSVSRAPPSAHNTTVLCLRQLRCGVILCYFLPSSWLTLTPLPSLTKLLGGPVACLCPLPPWFTYLQPQTAQQSSSSCTQG